MEKEHLVWRPNSISPTEWDRLTREEQLHWWSKNSSSQPPRSHPLRAVELYNTGLMTESEVPNFVFERLTDENVNEFMAGCSSAVREILRAQVQQLPADQDESGWKRFVICRGFTYAPWVPIEEIQREQEELDRSYRHGVRLFRETFPTQDSP